MLSAADKIKVVDTDGDGVLTAEEHAVGSRVMFERMDTNRDGFLTKDELAAGHARMLTKPSRWIEGTTIEKGEGRIADGAPALRAVLRKATR